MTLSSQINQSLKKRYLICLRLNRSDLFSDFLWEISVLILDIYRYLYLQNISFYLRVYFIPACSVASAADIHSDSTSVKHDIQGKVCIFW